MWLFVSVMDWRPVQGVPRLLPYDLWDRLQPPRDPTDGLSGYRKWMDGLISSFAILSSVTLALPSASLSSPVFLPSVALNHLSPSSVNG